MKKKYIGTSFFANANAFVTPVGASLVVPLNSNFPERSLYKPLGPNLVIAGKYAKGEISRAQFEKLYHGTVLNKLEPKIVADELFKFGDLPVLLGFSKDRNKCHRSLIGDWIYKATGIEVIELDHEPIPE